MNDGGPAFPGQPYLTGGDPCYPHSQTKTFDRGMSLRDWFAGKAMNAIAIEVWSWCNEDSDATDDEMAARLAGLAYKLADALLAQRVKARG